MTESICQNVTVTLWIKFPELNYILPKSAVNRNIFMKKYFIFSLFTNYYRANSTRERRREILLSDHRMEWKKLFLARQTGCESRMRMSRQYFLKTGGSVSLAFFMPVPLDFPLCAALTPPIHEVNWGGSAGKRSVGSIKENRSFIGLYRKILKQILKQASVYQVMRWDFFWFYHRIVKKEFFKFQKKRDCFPKHRSVQDWSFRFADMFCLGK